LTAGLPSTGHGTPPTPGAGAAGPRQLTFTFTRSTGVVNGGDFCRSERAVEDLHLVDETGERVRRWGVALARVYRIRSDREVTAGGAVEREDDAVRGRGADAVDVESDAGACLGHGHVVPCPVAGDYRPAERLGEASLAQKEAAFDVAERGPARDHELISVLAECREVRAELRHWPGELDPRVDREVLQAQGGGVRDVEEVIHAVEAQGLSNYTRRESGAALQCTAVAINDIGCIPIPATSSPAQQEVEHKFVPQPGQPVRRRGEGPPSNTLNILVPIPKVSGDFTPQKQEVMKNEGLSYADGHYPHGPSFQNPRNPGAAAPLPAAIQGALNGPKHALWR